MELFGALFGKADPHLVPVEWRKRFCDAITSGDLLEFKNIYEICGDKMCFPIESKHFCDCWREQIDHKIGDQTMAFPQCRRLAERIRAGTCDCTDTRHGRLICFTSLHLACYYGQLEIVKCLLQFCNIAGKLTKKVLLTPLMVTSLSDVKDVAPSIASLLIDAGAKIDEQVATLYTALHLAVINNNADLVKLYLQSGASINIPAFEVEVNNTPGNLYKRCARGEEEVYNCGLTPLWFAAKLLPPGSQCEELLLASGASVTEGFEACSPLIEVAHKEGLEGILRYVKSPGFDVNHYFPTYGTHLMNAFRKYTSYGPDDARRRMWFQVMEHYLDMGIDVNVEDKRGYTFVSYCLEQYEVLELLISYGGNVNHADRDGLTILMEAFKVFRPISMGTRTCVRLLVENGADTNAVCKYGRTALLYALDKSYSNIFDIRLLFEYNMDMEGSYMSKLHNHLKPLLYTAYDYENFEVAELFFQYGIDMTKQNWLLDIEHLPKGLKGNDELYNKLLHLYENPLDLSVLARNKVRRLLGRDVSKTVTQLGLPSNLEDFVCCK